MDEKNLRKINGKCDAFGTLLDRLLENHYPKESIALDDNSMCIQGDVTIIKSNDITSDAYIEETVVVLFKLDAHPIFVSTFTELLIDSGINYKLSECFISDPDGHIIFESELKDIGDGCSIIERATTH